MAINPNCLSISIINSNSKWWYKTACHQDQECKWMVVECVKIQLYLEVRTKHIKCSNNNYSLHYTQLSCPLHNRISWWFLLARFNSKIRNLIPNSISNYKIILCNMFKNNKLVVILAIKILRTQPLNSNTAYRWLKFVDMIVRIPNSFYSKNNLISTRSIRIKMRFTTKTKTYSSYKLWPKLSNKIMVRIISLRCLCSSNKPIRAHLLAKHSCLGFRRRMILKTMTILMTLLQKTLRLTTKWWITYSHSSIVTLT